MVGVSTRSAAVITGVPRSTATRAPAATDVPPVGRPPANRLSPTEYQRVLDVLTGDEFVDHAPRTVYAHLLDQGVYLCSERTMYRILADRAMAGERRRQARHPARQRPELTATGPRQVYTWDITKLKGPTKGVYYDAYVMIDIYSRYIVGVRVHSRETGELAEHMMRAVFDVHGIPQVVHADRGTSMTSKTVSDLLEDLGVIRSHSRPKVSNDNPYSEAWFKTCKYAASFPERFNGLAEARAFMNTFVEWYNHDHRHSGIGMHTPGDVHYHLAEQKDKHREAVLEAARAAYPQRFTSTTGGVMPKILRKPHQVWINPPEHEPPQHSTEQAA